VGFLVAALTGFGNRIGALLADQVGGGRRFGREMQGVRLEIRHESPGEREVELRRVLGLDSDRPFPEEDEDWEDRYTFELEWSDHKGGRWPLALSLEPTRQLPELGSLAAVSGVVLAHRAPTI
jgi:hypothetical protein